MTVLKPHIKTSVIKETLAEYVIEKIILSTFLILDPAAPQLLTASILICMAQFAFYSHIFLVYMGQCQR